MKNFFSFPIVLGIYAILSFVFSCSPKIPLEQPEPVKPEKLVLSVKTLEFLSDGTNCFKDSIPIILSWGFDLIKIDSGKVCMARYDSSKKILKVFFGGHADLGISDDAFLIYTPEGDDQEFVLKSWPEHAEQTAYQSASESGKLKFWTIKSGEGSKILFFPNRKLVSLPGKVGGLKKK